MVFKKVSLVLTALLLACGDNNAACASRSPVWGPLFDMKRLMMTPPSSRVHDAGQGSLSLPLYNVADVLYYFEMEVGTPPQTVRVAIDTTMSNIGISTVTGGAHKVYNHSRSTTYQPDGRPGAFRDETDGILVQDRLGLLGDVSALGQHFVEITNVTSYGPVYQLIPYDGWFGIGRNQTGTVGGFPTLLRALTKQGVLKRPCLSISTPRGHNGRIDFGGTDDLATLGPYTVIPTDPHPGLWAFDVLDIKVGDEPIQVPRSKMHSSRKITHGFAALDIVMPYIVGDVDSVSEIAKMVNATLLDYGVFAVPCDAQLPNITFVSGLPPDGELTLTARELVGRRVDATQLCEFTIAAHRNPASYMVADWALGAPLFHRYSFQFCWFDMPAGPAAPVVAAALHA